MGTGTASKRQGPLVERAGWAVYWNAAFFPLKAVIGFASSIVVVRLLRTEGYSLYNVAVALLTTLGLLADLGIERTLPRFYPEVEMRYGRRGVLRLLLWISLIKGAVLVPIIAVLMLAPERVLAVTGLHVSSDEYWLLGLVSALLVLGAVSDVSLQLLYTHFRQMTTNGLDILAAIVNPTLRAFFVLIGWGVFGAVFALFLTTVVSVIVSVWFAIRVVRTMSEEPHSDAALVRRPSERPLRSRLMFYAGLNYLTNWSVYLYDLSFVVLMLGVIIVAPREEATQVAIVSLAYNFTRQFLRALVVPLTGVQTPLFARLYAQGRFDGLKTAYVTLTKFMILALLPAGVGLVLVSRNLLQIFYGQKLNSAVLNPRTLPFVVGCTAILAFGLFGEAIISIGLNVMMVYERYRAVISARLTALISVPLMVLLVPGYGAMGAAIAVAVASLGSRSVSLYYAMRLLGMPFPGGFFVRVGTASIVMGLVLLPFLYFFEPQLWITIVMIGLGGLVFWAAFKLLGGIDESDKERFRTLRLPGVNTALRFL